MGLTGYFRSVRVARIATLVLSGTLVAAAIPAEARLSHPTIGGPISDGFFQGMPVRVEARARLSESELTGVAGADCHDQRQAVRDRLGASVLRTVRVCE